MNFTDALHWLVRRYRATVINDIWLPVFLFSAWAAAIQLISHYVHDLSISNQILTVLGTVLGLIVSFPTSSAYERYQVRRRLLATIRLSSTNLATLIWVHVPVYRALQPGEVEDPARSRSLEAVIEKRSMINLVQAFSVSVKHLLRGEPGIYYADLWPLVSFLPRFIALEGASLHEDSVSLYEDSASNQEGASLYRDSVSLKTGAPRQDGVSRQHRPPDEPASRNDSQSSSKNSELDPEQAFVDGPLGREELRPASNPPKTAYDVKRKPTHVYSNVPMELNLFLQSYFAVLLKQNLIVPTIAAGFLNMLGSLQDCVANLEHVRSTSPPFAYQPHLRMCMWIYLTFLPFQIRAAYEWLTIPATAFASFLLLGFLEIGHGIEDPFGYDLNDIDLDAFCLEIQCDIHEICAHPVPDSTSYILSAEHRPFAPADNRTAREIVTDTQGIYHDAKTGMSSIHRTLLRNWREVNGYRVSIGDRRNRGSSDRSARRRSQPAA